MYLYFKLKLTKPYVSRNIFTIVLRYKIQISMNNAKVFFKSVLVFVALICLPKVTEGKGGGRGGYGTRGWGSGNIRRGYSSYYESR